MVKRFFEDTERFETVRECLEAQIKEQEITNCLYDFDKNGNCACYQQGPSHKHFAEPNEMIRIAELFFNEFDWVHFEGWGKDGKTSLYCYMADETEESFKERFTHKKEVWNREKYRKWLEMRENKVSFEEIKKILLSDKWFSSEEWEEF